MPECSKEVARKPLNGIKTHPLSAHALAELRNIAQAPEPRTGVNPGVVDRLLREALVEIVMLPSPFKTHRGALVDHLAITQAGKQRLSRGAAGSEDE